MPVIDVNVTWANGLDPKSGRPIEKPEARYSAAGKPALVATKRVRSDGLKRKSSRSRGRDRRHARRVRSPELLRIISRWIIRWPRSVPHFQMMR